MIILKSDVEDAYTVNQDEKILYFQQIAKTKGYSTDRYRT